MEYVKGKKQKDHTVGTVPKYNWNTVETNNVDTHNIHIYTWPLIHQYPGLDNKVR
jgi:hypothetical protein